MPGGIIGFLNAQSKYPGYFGNYSWSPTQHNGYLTEEIDPQDKPFDRITV